MKYLQLNSPECIEAINKRLADPQLRREDNFRRALLKAQKREAEAASLRETKVMTDELNEFIKHHSLT